jgi:alcohol dehydrogenase, propanol-preferring
VKSASAIGAKSRGDAKGRNDMKAWQFTEIGAPLTLREVADPQPAPDGIVIDTRAAGLCHSDVSFLDGTLTPLLPFAPITLGHEIAGVVSAVGSNVTGFTLGDRVGVPAAIEGPGTSSDGGFAPRVAVQAHLVVHVPDSVPWQQAAAATDARPISTDTVPVAATCCDGEMTNTA